MSEIELFATHAVEPPWRPGDIIIDNKGEIFQRAGERDVADGWCWRQGAECALRSDGRTAVPEGTVAEHYPTRPLILLTRDGRPVHTIINS